MAGLHPADREPMTKGFGVLAFPPHEFAKDVGRSVINAAGRHEIPGGGNP